VRKEEPMPAKKKAAKKKKAGKPRR